MPDDFKVRVFVPTERQGNAAAGIQAAVRIAAEFGYDVQVHPMDLCPDADVEDGALHGVRIANGTFDVTETKQG